VIKENIVWFILLKAVSYCPVDTSSMMLSESIISDISKHGSHRATVFNLKHTVKVANLQLFF